MPKKKIMEEAAQEITERPEAEETLVPAAIPPEEATAENAATAEEGGGMSQEMEKRQAEDSDMENDQSFPQPSFFENEAQEIVSISPADGPAPETSDEVEAEPEFKSEATEDRASEAPYGIDYPTAVAEGASGELAEEDAGTDVDRGDNASAETVSESETPLGDTAQMTSADENAAGSQENRTAGDERRAFYSLDFNELDRGLSPEQRQEWNSIYASYRGHNAMSGTIVGVDRHRLRVRDRKTGEMTSQHLYCAIVIPFRVRVLIPETEMWISGEERPSYVIRNMAGAKIDFVIIHVDREGGFAVGSRRQAMPSRRYYFSTQPSMNAPGSRVSCDVLVVGPRRCLVSCHGYDMDLSQRELSYTAVPDLREIYHSGQTLNCVVKAYDRESGRLSVSVKETVPNPYDGAEFRHPVQSHRQGVIAGKYGGGVFCNLPDGVTVMCNYSFHYDDASFRSGDRVMLIIQRYDDQKKQVYGKIVAKC